jgi:hypothetical protein
MLPGIVEIFPAIPETVTSEGYGDALPTEGMEIEPKLENDPELSVNSR